MFVTYFKRNLFLGSPQLPRSAMSSPKMRHCTEKRKGMCNVTKKLLYKFNLCKIVKD